MLWHFSRTALSGLLCALLIGCATTPEPSDRAPSPAEWPSFSDPLPGDTVFQVDPEASEVLVRVDPEGPMARLGHSHVIGGPVMSGIIITGGEIRETRLDLKIDAAAFEVDRPEWRRAEGLKPELNADARAGTRRNMRSERVLDVAQHPTISIRSVSVTGPGWLPAVTIRIRLRGETRQRTVPVAVLREDGIVQAIGRFELLQTDFGIKPFSAAGGALQVSNRMQIRFRIVARHRAESPG